MFPGGSPIRRQTAATVALALALLLAGCSEISGGDPDPPDANEAVEGFSSVGVYNLTITTESTVDNRTTEARIERTIRPGTGKRYVVTEQDGNLMLTVSNGTTSWRYWPRMNQAQRIPVEEQQMSHFTDQLRELMNSLDSDSESDPLVPLAPLFAPGSDTDSGSDNETTFGPGPTETEYQGIETISGRDAHVITMETTEATDTDMQQTLYYDSEYFVLLQSEYNITVEGDRVTGQTRVQSVDFSPSVDESIFEFEPPENVTLLNTEVDQYDTYVGLNLGSDGHVPDPDLPTDYEFHSGVLRGENLTMEYRSGVKTVFISRSTAVTDPPGEPERIDYRGRTYRYSDELRGRLVQWECGDRLYTVRGDLERDTLLDVGASIECPAPAGG